MPENAPLPRHDSLDALRGFAVLLMFAVNIQLFAFVWIAADIPGLQSDFQGWGNRAVWLVTQGLVSQSGTALFIPLFGAALVLNVRAARQNPTRQWPRLSWLLLLGLLHAYLFWYGDILVPLALVAMIVVAANGMTLRSLWGLGLGLIGFTGLMLLAGSAIGALIGDGITAAGAMGFNPEAIAGIETLYRTGFVARLGYNMSIALQSEMMQIVFMSGRMAGCLLLGMAALRSGFLTGQCAIMAGSPPSLWALARRSVSPAPGMRWPPVSHPRRCCKTVSPSISEAWRWRWVMPPVSCWQQNWIWLARRDRRWQRSDACRSAITSRRPS